MTKQDLFKLWQLALDTEDEAYDRYAAAKKEFGPGFSSDPYCNALYNVYVAMAQTRRTVFHVLRPIEDIISTEEPTA